MGVVDRSSQGVRQLPVGPYWYENLGADEFQKLCQTLIVKEFGAGVRCWPVGQKDCQGPLVSAQGRS